MRKVTYKTGKRGAGRMWTREERWGESGRGGGRRRQK